MLNIKKIYYLIIGIIIGSLISNPFVFANSNIKLIINGEEIHCDPPPQIINNRIFVPIRYIAEPLGVTIEWNNINKEIIINSKKENEINLNINDINTNDFKLKNTNQIKTVLWNNMEAITLNNEIYFLASDYENIFYKENQNYLKWNKENETFTLIINNQAISTFPYKIINNRTYIHSKYYIDINQILQ